MPTATLKKIAENLGISLDDTIEYVIDRSKGLIIIKIDASDNDIEFSAVHDISEDFLTDEEISYYKSLNEI